MHIMRRMTPAAPAALSGILLGDLTRQYQEAADLARRYQAVLAWRGVAVAEAQPSMASLDPSPADCFSSHQRSSHE